MFLRIFRHLMRWLVEKISRRRKYSEVQLDEKPKDELEETLGVDAADVGVGTVKGAWLKGELLGEVQRFVQTQRSPHTRRAYEGDLRQFIGWLRAQGHDADSLDVLLSYRDWLVTPTYSGGAGLSRTTANRKFSTLRAFLSWLQMRGRVAENPAVFVKNFRARTESPTLGFSDEEVARMLALPNQRTPSGLQHALILHLLFFLGLRRSELVALRADHLGRAWVDQQEFLTLRVPGKGDKERVLPLPPPVVEILDRFLTRNRIEVGHERPLFRPVRNNVTFVKEKPLSSHAIYYIVLKYAKKAGVLNRVSPHSCRATAISNALDHAASHRSVQDMAGWSSPLMIERYDKRRTALTDSAVHVVQY